jgi:hypothetical protein
MTYEDSHIGRRHVDKVDKRFRLIESVETVDIVDVSTGYGAITANIQMQRGAWLGGIRSLEPNHRKPTA